MYLKPRLLLFVVIVVKLWTGDHVRMIFSILQKTHLNLSFERLRHEKSSWPLKKSRIFDQFLATKSRESVKYFWSIFLLLQKMWKCRIFLDQFFVAPLCKCHRCDATSWIVDVVFHFRKKEKTLFINNIFVKTYTTFNFNSHTFK